MDQLINIWQLLHPQRHLHSTSYYKYYHIIYLIFYQYEHHNNNYISYYP
jgi:hypothetical protein